MDNSTAGLHRLKETHVFSRGVRLYSLAGLLLMPCVIFPVAAQDQPMEEAFADPPHSFSMAPYWAWNGTLKPEELKRQIDQMVDKGVYAAFMHARPGIENSETPYFSDGWWDAVQTAVDYGKEAGFTPWLYDEDKWPSGSAGGRVLARDPEGNRQKVLRRVEQRITGPVNVAVSFPGATYVIAGRLADENTFTPDTLADITAYNGPPRNERSAAEPLWVCPAGNWMLTGYVYETFRDDVDHMNPKTVRDFIDITHEEYARRFGQNLGETFPGIFFDEIGMGAGTDPDRLVWEEGFAERFRQMKGYDLVTLLPGLEMDIGPRTPTVRCDYYEVYTTLYEEAWFKQLSEWCAAHGLKLTGHTIEELNRYVKEGDYMQTMRHLHIPTTDNEDFRYTWPRTVGAWKPKQAASIAHLYGQPQTGVEALGGAGWAFNLDMARYGFNMLSAYGITFFIPHYFGYAMDNPTNMDDWPNSWFFRNPYWKYFKTLADSVRRTSYVLSGGAPIVDAVVLYPQCNQWSGYGPGTTEETVTLLTSLQVDVDVIDPPSLLGAETADGTLRAGQMAYRALIVPGLRCLRRSEADQIRQFAESGGLVVVHDRWPSDSPEGGKDDPYLTEFVRDLEAKGVHLSPLPETAARIEAAAGRDLTVLAGDAVALRYQHVEKGAKAIYWIANGSQNTGVWRLKFRAVGSPSRWQPEDGSITPIDVFVRRGGYTECTVALDGWQGCFVVFDRTTEPPEGGLYLAKTPLREVVVKDVRADSVTLTALAPAGLDRASIEGEMLRGGEARAFKGSTRLNPGPGVRSLDSDWSFLPVGDALDDVWSVDIDSADLAIPVMRYRWERPAGPDLGGWQDPYYNDSRWREIKVADALNKKVGTDRYRSRWDGRFITFRQYHPFDLERFFAPKIGGKTLQCRKTFVLPPGVTQGTVAVVCPGPFEVLLNGTVAGTGHGGIEAESIDLKELAAGENTLCIVAEEAAALLAEGRFEAEFGAQIPFFTDKTWQASAEGSEWAAAWEYVAPPEPPFGEPQNPLGTPLPDAILYREKMPPGMNLLYEPAIEGTWEAWVDGQPVTFEGGQAHLPPLAATRVLAIRVRLAEGDRGLLEPVRIQCVPAARPLGSWTEAGLDWYSGRGRYFRDFTLDTAFLQPDIQLELDLGRVNFCAEIWINGKLVGTRPWPPYRMDITGFVQPGENRVDIVVANLLANRMRWDIYDSVKASLQNRKWHDDSIERDAWCLESGLIGPVRILPFRRIELACPLSDP